MNMNDGHKCHLDVVPSICPTTRLEMPMPIICMDVANPIAVPSVAWGTTRGIEGHMLAYNTQTWQKTHEKHDSQTARITPEHYHVYSIYIY